MIRIPNKPSKIKRFLTTINNYSKQIVIFLSMVFILSLFFPRGKTLLYSYQINDIAREEVVAPFNFPILKSEKKLNEDLNEAIKSEPYLFIRSQNVVDNQINSINNYFELIKLIQLATKKLKNSTNELYRNRFSDQYNITRVAMQSDSVDLSILKNKISNEFSFAVDNEKWKTIFETDPDDLTRINLDSFKDEIIQIARNRWAEGIYDISLSEIISNEVAINTQEAEAPELTLPSSYNDIQEAWTIARVDVTNKFPENIDIRRDLGYSLVVEFMKPNLLFDRETTERRQKAREDRVPRNKGIILKNERIVDANTRITDDDLQKLLSLSVALNQKSIEGENVEILLAYLGRILVISIVVSFFFTFLLTYRTPIFEDWKMVLLIALIFIIEVGLGYLFSNQLKLSEYLIPTTVAAMVLTIMFDARIAFMGITSIILLIGILIGNNVEFMGTSMLTASVGLFSVRKLRRRSQLFSAIFALIASSALVILAQGLFKGNDW